MSRDMEPANWARTYPRLMRNIQELVALGCEVITPPNFDKPPRRRERVHINPSAPSSRDHHPLL